MERYNYQILNHNLAEENRKDTLSFVSELIAGTQHYPTELEKYSYSVMGWIHRLSNCFRDLEHAKVYLKHFRSNKWYKEAEIVQGNSINYHFSKYTMTLITLDDVSLLLVNDTFRLGYPERLCSIDNILKNSWISSSNVRKPLKQLSRLLEPWRQTRNLFIHRGWQIYREKLTVLEGYELLYNKGKIEKQMTNDKIKSLYQSEINDIISEFDKIEPSLFHSVNELLTSLVPVYLSWRDRIQSADK